MAIAYPPCCKHGEYRRHLAHPQHLERPITWIHRIWVLQFEVKRAKRNNLDLSSELHQGADKCFLYDVASQLLSGFSVTLGLRHAGTGAPNRGSKSGPCKRSNFRSATAIPVALFFGPSGRSPRRAARRPGGLH